jgi:adenosylhomocysteine nucleosidase
VRGRELLGAIAALPAEARCIGTDARVVSRVAGIGHEAARLAADALLASGAGALVSWGCAAGLDRSLTAGTLVLADRVVRVTPRGDSAAADLRPTERWADGVAQRLEGTIRVVRGAIACPEHLLGTTAAKRALADAQSGVLAADMESAAVGHAAASAGVPWIVVRAVADTADMRVPSSFGFAIDRTGRLRPLWLAAALIRHPWDLTAVPALAHGFRLALRTLREVVRSVGPTLLAPFERAHDTGGFA